MQDATRTLARAHTQERTRVRGFDEEGWCTAITTAVKGRHGSDYFTELLFESGYKFSVPVDANVSVEVVVTRKSYTIRNFPYNVLPCLVVFTSLKSGLVSATVSALK